MDNLLVFILLAMLWIIAFLIGVALIYKEPLSKFFKLKDWNECDEQDNWYRREPTLNDETKDWLKKRNK